MLGAKIKHIFGVLLLAIIANMFIVHFYNISARIAEKKVYVKPTRSIIHMTFGYKAVVADSLWIRLIQDYGLCDQNLAPNQKDRTSLGRKANCRLGWVYHMLDVITFLAPDFRMPYATGATVLSIMVDDIEGATRLFEKAIAQFPRDWPILYRAAYHQLFELGDKARAADLLTQAANAGGPTWLRSLAAKLYTQTGQALLGKLVLEQYLKEHGQDFGAERIRYRLEKVNAELAKEEKILLGQPAITPPTKNN